MHIYIFRIGYSLLAISYWCGVTIAYCCCHCFWRPTGRRSSAARPRCKGPAGKTSGLCRRAWSPEEHIY